MNTELRRSLRRGHGRDEGVAMVVAIALMGLVAVVVLSLVAVALSEARGSGRDRQRSVAVMSAEGQVDTLVATIQSSPPADLPCGDYASTETVVSDDLQIDAVVTYFDSAGAEVDCANVPTATDLEQATVLATSASSAIAGTSSAVRTVETLLRLNPSYGNDLDKAIFGSAGVVVENNGQVVTEDGQPNADIYSNGDFTCAGNQEYQGSVHAQGDIDLTDSCLIAVDAWAGGEIDATHPQATVNGRALAAGGDVDIDGHLGQYARATGSATGAACVPSEKCVGGVAVAAPPVVSFPHIAWTDPDIAAAWQSELGFTHVVNYPPTGYSCGAPTGPGDKMDNVGEWIEQNASMLAGNTVLLSTCPTQVYMSGISLNFNHNFAVFSSAGIKIDGNPVISSDSSAERNLYLMQPWGSTCTAAPGIYLGNNVAFTNTANVMLYSPCDIDKRNQSDIFGQIYAGGVAHLSNNTAMTFQLLPMAGVDATSSVIEYYDVEILYKRETVG